MAQRLKTVHVNSKVPIRGIANPFIGIRRNVQMSIEDIGVCLSRGASVIEVFPDGTLQKLTPKNYRDGFFEDTTTPVIDGTVSPVIGGNANPVAPAVGNIIDDESTMDNTMDDIKEKDIANEESVGTAPDLPAVDSLNEENTNNDNAEDEVSEDTDEDTDVTEDEVSEDTDEDTDVTEDEVSEDTDEDTDVTEDEVSEDTDEDTDVTEDEVSEDTDDESIEETDEEVESTDEESVDESTEEKTDIPYVTLENIESFTKAQLIEFANANGIDVNGKNKTAIIAAIREYLSQE